MKEGGFVFSFVGSYKPVTIFLDFVRDVAAAGWKKRRGLRLS